VILQFEIKVDIFYDLRCACLGFVVSFSVKTGLDETEVFNLLSFST